MIEMGERIRLSETQLGKKYRIVYVMPEINNYDRLREMGFAEGSEIVPLYRSISGEPTAYLVWDTVIGLRREESEK
ncbi:MAG: ferrous iron transport protein A, partial [Firmicutes bacterium]|nr:ferrous iron transport protein A [Bacillota bacterium]